MNELELLLVSSATWFFNSQSCCLLLLRCSRLWAPRSAIRALRAGCSCTTPRVSCSHASWSWAHVDDCVWTMWYGRIMDGRMCETMVWENRPSASKFSPGKFFFPSSFSYVYTPISTMRRELWWLVTWRWGHVVDGVFVWISSARNPISSSMSLKLHGLPNLSLPLWAETGSEVWHRIGTISYEFPSDTEALRIRWSECSVQSN